MEFLLQEDYQEEADWLNQGLLGGQRFLEEVRHKLMGLLHLSF